VLPRPLLAATIVLAAALAQVPAALAGVNAWSAGRAIGGDPTIVAIQGQRAFLGARNGGEGGGLLGSTDGGATWHRLTSFGYRDVTGIAIDPAAGQPVYATTFEGVFRSLDRGATWAEIDGAALTLPQSRMKAGPQHRLPRSEPALAILRVIANMQHEPGSLIFPGMTQRMPLSAMSLTAVLRRMGRGDLTAHGSRSTFHDWAVEATASRIMFSSKRWHMRSALQWRPPIAAAICSPSGLS